MPYFDIKLTAVSEGHILKDTGRVVITDNPDPLPPPTEENLMVWDCIYFNNSGTRSINYKFKPNHEYAICILDSYKSNELIWAYLPFTGAEESESVPLHFPCLDDYALYQNGKVYVDSESDSSSKIYRLLERPLRTINSESERTNPGEWLVENINMSYPWQSDREYYFVAKDSRGVYAAHLYTHHTWHGNIARLHETQLYISSYRMDYSRAYVMLKGKKGINSGGSDGDRYLKHSENQLIQRAYSRPFDISTSEESIAPNSNTWLHKLTLNKQDKGFSTANFNWSKNNTYLSMGLDDSGEWEIGSGTTIIDDSIESISTYNKKSGIGNMAGDNFRTMLSLDGAKKSKAGDGRIISVYQKPLYMSDETCGSSSTLPVNNEGNWVINQLPVNAYETTENIGGTPVSYITNCGITLHLNKGLNGNNVVDDVNGSILVQVLDKIDSNLQQGTDKGVLQVAQFDWQSGSSVEINVTRNQLTGDLTTVPDTDTVTHNLNSPLTLAVDDFDDGVLQFDITAKITQADGDVIQFGVMQLLINKTSGKDTANEYMRPDEKLF